MLATEREALDAGVFNERTAKRERRSFQAEYAAAMAKAKDSQDTLFASRSAAYETGNE